MNVDTARLLVPLYRTGKDVNDRVEKAVKMAESNDELRTQLDQQKDFDEFFVKAIHAIQPPSSFRERLTNNAGKPKSRARHAGNPAILCAIFGILVFAGILVFLQMESAEDFPGRDRIEPFIEMNDHMTGAELERTQLTAGHMADNMMLSGFDGFAVPEEIAPLPAVGWRVFRHGQSGHKVAQLAIDRNNLIVFVFRTADFGVEPGKNGEWRVFNHKGWAAAVTERGNLCTLLTFPGDNAAMKSFLKSLKP